MLCCLAAASLVSPISLSAQEQGGNDALGEPTTEAEQAAPEQVNVDEVAGDEEIAERLTRILAATEWFVAPRVEVRDGVAFLDGRAYTNEQREWAGNLARNTQDVVATVNRIEVMPRSLLDFSPAWTELRRLWRGVILALPIMLFGVVVLLLSWLLSALVVRLGRRFFLPRLRSQLLANIAARMVAIPIFLVGLYIVLQVAGLTRLALTILGGTGIVGIIIGLAFRDITENFLASVILSMRQPFQRDDLIEVADQIGIVQQLNTRTTVLMTIDGNHVQIPNATVFTNIIKNYTMNPNRRSDFVIGIGYESAILEAQKIIADVLHNHPMVNEEPEPLVLVDQLANSVVLRVYYWYDATEYSPIKVKSSILRLAKRALQDANISIPDEAREVVFPNGIPVVQVHQPDKELQSAEAIQQSYQKLPKKIGRHEPITTEAEGDRRTTTEEIRELAEQLRESDDEEDLLDGR
jgi:small conductance mechanosensitive channel